MPREPAPALSPSGVAVAETDDAQALAAWALAWSDLMTLETYPVLDDAGVSRVLFG